MSFPNYETYKRLYARYLKPGRLEQFFKLAGPLSGKTVLDLCAGGGDITLEALNKGAAEVIAVEESGGMTKPLWSHMQTANLSLNKTSVSGYLILFEYHPKTVKKADVVFCKQAVNYWLDAKKAQHLAGAMNPGGVFIFNTFNQRPSFIPTIKYYEYNDNHYTEISWLVGNMVQHVQICEGMVPHTTAFKWIPPEEFESIAKCAGFKSEVFIKDNTSVYKWTKK